MMDRTKLEKLADMMQDEVFAAKFKDVSKETAICILAENGLVFSSEEFEEIGKFISEENTELDENSLDNISGGAMSWDRYWEGLKNTLKGFWDGLWS